VEVIAELGKVQIKLPPWMANLMNAGDTEWFTLEKEIKEGTTVGELLTELARNHAGFRTAVFNPDAGSFSDQLVVVLNDSLLPQSEAAGVRLSPGDNIMLLQVYSGG